jgi:hypothetical protein
MRKIYTTIAVVIMVFNQGLLSQQPDEFKPSGKVLMEVFGDYYYKFGSDSLLGGDGEYQKTTKDMNAFAFRRVYLGYEYNFTEKFYANVIFEGNDALQLNDKKRAITLKYAYFEWKEIFPGSKLIVGAQKTPIWESSEKIWGYRSVEKTIADFRKFGSSNDVGVGLNGRFDKNGIFGYSLLIANGNSQSPENDKYKEFYGTLNANLVNKKLIIEVHSNYEKTGRNTDNYLQKITLGFNHEIFSIGLEAMNNIENISDSVSVNSIGTSVFGRANIIKDRLSLFGRFDMFDKNIDDDVNGYTEVFTIFGIDYKPTKQISIIPNLWINAYSPKNQGTYKRKADIVGRVTFRFKL